jgi:hypothetical protein
MALVKGTNIYLTIQTYLVKDYGNSAGAEFDVCSMVEKGRMVGNSIKLNI